MSARRQAILRATKHLVVRHGLEGVSMRTVAQRVGVSATALYRHFDNKRVLLRDLATEGFERLAARFELTEAEPTAERRLWALIEHFVDFALEEPEYFALMFFVSGRHVRKFPEDFAAERSITAKFLSREVKQCMQDGILRADDPLETMLTIWAQAHGLIALHRTGRFSADDATFRRIYLRSMKRLMSGLQTTPPRDHGGMRRRAAKRKQ